MGNCGVGFAPVARRPARLAHRADGGRRGHPRHRARRGHPLGVGDASPSTSTRSTPRRARARRRRAGAARRGARATSWASAARATSPPRPTTSRRWPRIVAEGDRRRRARLHDVAHDRCTAPSTASRCPARSPRRTSCSRSAARWPRSAAACSSSRPRASRARTCPRPTRSSTGCAGSRRRRAPGHLRLRAARRRARRLEAPARPGAGEAADDGVPLRPQVAGRPIGLLLGLQTFHPFNSRPTYAALAGLPLDERGRATARPRGARPHPQRGSRRSTHARRTSAWASTGSSSSATRPTTSPRPSTSIAARAPRAGVDPVELLYDLLLAGRRPRAARAAAARLQRLQPRAAARDARAPASVLGLGDGGAHVGAICDASIAPRSCSRTGCATAPAGRACRSSW